MKHVLNLSVIVLALLFVSCRSGRNAFRPDRKFSPAELKKDYSLFRGILEENHPSLYWYAPRDSMNYFFDQGYAQLTDSMTEPQFRTVLSHVVSRIGCGHTGIRYSKSYNRYLDTANLAQFPLILKFWEDTAVVAANLNRRDTILKRGTLLHDINGMTTAQLEDTLFRYIISDGYNLTGKYQYLSTGFNFSSWYKNLFGQGGKINIGYFNKEGVVQETTISLYDPAATRKADTGRKTDKPPPPAFTPPKPGRKERKNRERFYTRNLQLDSATHTALMVLNTFERGNHLTAFFHRSFRTLEEKQVRNLVIDVRSNGGGDATNSTLLTRYIIDKKFRVADSLYAITRNSHYDRYIEKSLLYRILMHVVTKKRSDGKYHFGYFEKHNFSPKRDHHFNGQVYILTGGNSFSATSLFAGALKGQKNVTLVGEETGGGYYGNTAWMIPNVTLPVTKLRFRLPLFRLIVDKDREKNGHGVLPDVPALPTVEAISKGVDFKTARVKELIRLRDGAASNSSRETGQNK